MEISFGSHPDCPVSLAGQCYIVTAAATLSLNKDESLDSVRDAFLVAILEAIQEGRLSGGNQSTNNDIVVGFIGLGSLVPNVSPILTSSSDGSMSISDTVSDRTAISASITNSALAGSLLMALAIFGVCIMYFHQWIKKKMERDKEEHFPHQ